MPKSFLLCEDHRCRSRCRHELDRLESRFCEPCSIVRLTPGVSAFRYKQHLCREHQGKGMTLAIVRQNEIVDDQCAARLQRLAEFAENFDIVFGCLLMGNVPVDSVVILAGAEIDLVKITVDCFKPI